MKKLLLLLVLLISMSSYSQTVNGISVGKTKTETNTLLINKGFKQISHYNNSITYSGFLMNKDFVKLMILYTPTSKKVWKIVIMKNCYSWESVKLNFTKYNNILISKYGVPTEFLTFTDPYYEGDGYEMQALCLDKLEKSSYFKDLDDNFIVIRVNGVSAHEAYISIGYENKILSELDTFENSKIENKTF